MADTQRARLSAAPGADKEEIYGPDKEENLMRPLYATGGLLFPYTPDVVVTRSASYEDFHFTHSNYKYYQFKNSAPGEIQINGDFTVQTNQEGRYLLAVLQFLKSMTMIEYGLKTDSPRRGSPPPTLRFNYLGSHMFSNVPVVINMVNYNLQKDIDYVPVELPPEISGATTAVREALSVLDKQDKEQVKEAKAALTKLLQEQKAGSDIVYLPTKIFIAITLLVQQNPRDLRDNFNLSKFKSGKLLNRGYL